MELTLDEAVKKAKGWQAHGEKWHFHLLAPGCRFNAGKRHALVLEAADGEEAVSYTNQRPAAAGQTLVKMLHGRKIIDSRPAKVTNDAMLKITKRAGELTANKIPWHHHVLFPYCKFNISGKWCVLLEDPESGKILEATYEEEPRKDLKLLESAFYSQKK